MVKRYMATQSEVSARTDQLTRHNRELSILNAIAQALNREVDLAQSLRSTLALVVDLFDLKTGWVWLLDPGTGEPYLAAAQNLPPALANHPHKMEGWCQCLKTFRAGDMTGAANVNAIECSRLWGLVDGTDGLRYHSSIPLYAHGKKLGVFNVASQDWREISQDDLRLLYIIGDMVGIAVERARLFAESVELGAAEERNRLAREIHDTLAQGLTAIALQLEAAEALMDKDEMNPKAKNVVHDALKLARKNLEEARRSVMDLRAAPLEGRTLAQALEAMAKDHKGKSRANIHFHVVGGNQPLPMRIEAGLYRIAQEAFNNALQHAQANDVNMRLEVQPEQVKLIVEDDGRGFEPEKDMPGHYGLVGLNERVRLLGGRLNLQTEPKAGSRVEVVIPLNGQS